MFIARQSVLNAKYVEFMAQVALLIVLYTDLRHTTPQIFTPGYGHVYSTSYNSDIFHIINFYTACASTVRSFTAVLCRLCIRVRIRQLALNVIIFTVLYGMHTALHAPSNGFDYFCFYRRIHIYLSVFVICVKCGSR